LHTMSTSTLDQLEVVVLDCLLRLRSPNYVVICAIFGNDGDGDGDDDNDDDDEANDKFAALSCRRCMLHVASCKLPVAVCQEYVNWLANGCQCINLSCP